MLPSTLSRHARLPLLLLLLLLLLKLESVMSLGLQVGRCDSYIERWRVIGPLPVGKTELDGTGLAWPLGSADNNNNIISELAPGGEATWKELRTDRQTGQVQVAYQEGAQGREWQSLLQSLGNRAVLESQAWLTGELNVQETGHFSIHCSNLVSFKIGNETFAADLYQTKHVLGAVTLEKGKHTVTVRLRLTVTYMPRI